VTENNLFTTSDVAKQLDVHARTIRKWIDAFEDYIQPDLNERGHYMLNHQSIKRLKDIQHRLQEPNKTMKQIREELEAEGLIPTNNKSRTTYSDSNPQQPDTEQTLLTLQHTVERVGNMMEEMFDRMEHLEDHLYHLFESIEDLEHKIAAVGYDTLSPSEVHQMFEEVRKKQDQLKIELRSAAFSHRLSSAQQQQQQEQPFLPRRQQRKSRFFNLF